ncbi:MAG: ABC transporter ATP-binding protein [Planctomycetota bacterium]|nr:ABC transporter ATP-binding protein [Planctomycetota bacterium]MDE1889715.1 ABC transporter ATP-binding protein [Planctomycetota bacterium]MDE2217562.1 ABC transporter ATP-binding protein [Planctomycetota bacterium]
MNSDVVIEAKDLKKYYTRGTEIVKALDGVDFTIRSGEIVSIVGPSGSGKTTLMNLISCLDTSTSGTLIIGGQDVTHLKESQLINIRRKYIGFIFQQFYLMPNLFAIENVELPLIFAKKPLDKDKIYKVIETVGLKGRELIPAYMLSGGDKQRIAIARALINDPQVLIADEPTGKLELKVRDQLLELFRQLAQKGISVFIATHDLELAEKTERIIHLQDGKIVSKEQSSLYH